ncbi:hypothetical protein CR513_06524, partial [Mucuna pruriens]
MEGVRPKERMCHDLKWMCHDSTHSLKCMAKSDVLMTLSLAYKRPQNKGKGVGNLRSRICSRNIEIESLNQRADASSTYTLTCLITYALFGRLDIGRLSYSVGRVGLGIRILSKMSRSRLLHYIHLVLELAYYGYRVIPTRCRLSDLDSDSQPALSTLGFPVAIDGDSTGEKMDTETQYRAQKLHSIQIKTPDL